MSHMDNKKWLMENMARLELSLDGGFAFGCDECAKCCIHREDIILSPMDLFRGSAKLQISTEEFIAAYCEKFVGANSKMPIVRLLPRGYVRRCPLLKNRHCSIHDAKPAVCALYPLGRVIKTSEDGMPEIHYILQPVSCGSGDKQTKWTVREWLATFGIDPEDAAFIEWQKFVMIAVKKLNNLAENMPSDEKDRFYNELHKTLYCHYDVSGDLLPQLKENISSALTLIEAAGQKWNKED